MVVIPLKGFVQPYIPGTRMIKDMRSYFYDLPTDLTSSMAK